MAKRRPAKSMEDPLERLRDICMAMPEATERISHGEPTWFVRGKKVFVTYAEYHHDDRLACILAAPGGVQEALVRSDPARYFVPPYVGSRGWVGVRLDIEIDWTVIGELVKNAYRTVAPKRLAAMLDDPAA